MKIEWKQYKQFKQKQLKQLKAKQWFSHRKKFYYKKREKSESNIIQNIHRQLFQRNYDLHYLQWMQRNAKNYTAGIAVLAMLLSVTVVTLARQQETAMYPYKVNPSAFQEMVPMIAQATEDKKTDNSSTTNDADLLANPAWMQTNKTEQSQYQVKLEAQEQTNAILSPNAEETIAVTEKVIYCNPTEFADYMAPTNGTLEQDYGLQYNAVYEDYRFQTALCYSNGDGNVFACNTGTVTQIQLEEPWQLALQTQDSTIWYAGLETCNVQLGEQVLVGVPIGTATDSVSIQAVKNK